MNMLENRRSYQEAIGEFIVAFAEIEVWITLFDAVIKTKNAPKVPLVGSLSVPLNIKLKNIKRFITENLDNDYLKRWKAIHSEIDDLNLHRNHIIHGTGFSSLWGEYIRTAIDEERKFQSISFKNLSVNDIKALSQRTYHSLTGDNGIAGYFYQDFMKEARAYFSSHK
jgi:hypothetical protein